VKSSNPKNIFIPHGFEVNYTAGFLNGLAQNGVNVFALCCDNTAPRLSELSIPHENVRGSVDEKRRTLAKVWNLFGYYLRLLGFLCRNYGSTVHFTGIFRNELILVEGIILNLALRLFAGKYIYTVHNVLPHSREHSELFRRIYRFIYRVPHMLLVHTNKGRTQLMEEFGVPADKIALTSIGLNDEIPNTALTRREARDKLGIDAQERVILFFGKIDEYKGADTLLEAFQKIRLPDTRLFFVGTFRAGAFKARFKELLAASPSKGSIELVEDYVPNDQVECYFKAADVICLPYRNIYQSGVLFLALRFGTPLVVTDVGAFREFVGSGEGVVAKTNDVSGVADALREFFELQPKFEPAAIARNAMKYSWKTVCKPLKSLYQ